MHLALLPGLLLVLLAGAWSNISAQTVTTATAQLAITPTAALTPASTITSTVTSQSTAVPLPTVGPQTTNLRWNPFDWDFLTSVPTPHMGPFAWAYVVTMLAFFGVAAYFYFWKRAEWKRTNPVLRRAANRWAVPAMWIAAFGLLFAVFRVISFDFFNLRIWLYLWMLAALILVALFIIWLRIRYPQEMEKYQKTQRARQYLPTSVRPRQMAAQPRPGGGASNPITPGKKRKRR